MPGTGAPSRGIRPLLAAAIALLLALAGAPSAQAAGHPAPLTEPTAALERALECTAGVRDATRTPVILVHGTGSTPEESFSFGYAHVLPKQGIPVCTVQLPQRALVDFQRSVQYVVHAVRVVAERSGRRVSLLGHSQGGLLVAMAPMFWPDLADRVDDVIGLAGTYRGTEQANRACRNGECSVVAWQFRTTSDIIRAFARRTLPEGPSFTSIATAFDQVVTPAPEASRLRGARNLVVQDVCPGRPVEHFGIVGGAAAYGLALDALTHQGPADPARFDRSLCALGPMPGTDTVALARNGTTGIANSTLFLATSPAVRHEPVLRCPFDDEACPPPDLRLTRRCLGGRLRVALAGDTPAVRDVNFKLGRRLVRRDTRAPFVKTIDARTLRRATARRLRAVVYLEGPGSDRVVLARSLPRCR